MAETYSTYEAKSRFSEIIRRVRAGRRVIVSYRGKPVAEIKPVSESFSLEDRIQALTERGVIVGPASDHGPGKRDIRLGAPKKGALKRFLRSRD